MKALLMRKPGDVILADMPTPVPREDQVLIRIHAAGICVNDIRDYKGMSNFTYPRIGGHEYAGEIVEMGERVNRSRYHIGQKVVSYCIDNCGECYYCHHGLENICPDFKKSIAYQNPGGISGFFGFAQYIAADTRDLFLCDDEVPYEKLALTEPMACVLNSINRAGLCFGDDVLVIGGGTMGLLHVMLAKLRGVRVILSEPDEKRRKEALALGADIGIDPFACDVVEEVMRITGGIGANAVFDTSAIPALAGQAIDAAAQNGRIIMFSSLHPNEPVPVNLGAIHSTQKIITGAQNGSIETFRQAVALLSKGLFDPAAVIDAVYDYHDFNAAMQYAMRPDTYKVVLRITD